MGFWSDFGGLFGLGASSGIFGMVNSAMQYAMSREAQETQYQNQRKLNVQQSTLQRRLNKWNAQILPTYARQGMENAGFNPLMAINSGSAFSGGTSTQGGSATNANPVAPADFTGVLDSATNAYRTFKLDKAKNKAEVDNIVANTENTNARTKTEGYNQQLIHSQMLLNQINTELSKKDLSWKDRMYLMQEKTGYLNAAAAHLGAEAQQMNASTAKQSYQLDKEIADIEKDVQARYKKFGEEHPYLRNIDETFKRYLGGSAGRLLRK